jgi:hypothetical protein
MNLIGFKREPEGTFYLRLRGTGSCRASGTPTLGPPSALAPAPAASQNHQNSTQHTAITISPVSAASRFVGEACSLVQTYCSL